MLAGRVITSWSRRRFVADGLFIVGAAAPALGCAMARTGGEGAPHVSAKSPAAARAASAGSGAVRSARNARDRLTTLVHIDGSGPYHFLVDTGAESSLIAADLAAHLALPRGREVMVEGIIRKEPAHLVRIERLDLGRLVCRDLEVPALPRATLQVDGYLGLDVLDHHRVVLDFRSGTLTVSKPQGYFSALWERRNEAVVRTLGSSGRLRATNCLVDGVHAAAFIDTGAEVSVGNHALYAALEKHARNRRVPSLPVMLFGVTGGAIEGLGIEVQRIRLGELQWAGVPLTIARLEVFDIWGLSDQPALLFGMDCLRRFARVSIDYGRKELRFDLARAPMPQPLEAALPPPLAG